jgi:hypothetical protein
VFFARAFANEELVFRGASGVRSRVDDQLAVAAENAFAAAERVFDQFGGRQVFVDARCFDAFRNGDNNGAPCRAERVIRAKT